MDKELKGCIGALMSVMLVTMSIASAASGMVLFLSGYHNEGLMAMAVAIWFKVMVD